MQRIDPDGWERREHFAFFQRRVRPQIALCAPAEITGLALLRERLGREGAAFRLSDALYYLATRAANAVPEFRLRLVDKAPVAFSTVHAGFTYVPRGRTLHANCLARYVEDFGEFARRVEQARQDADAAPTLTPPGSEGQDLLYFSILPGLAFTSVSNPWGDPDEDSVPRILFGKVLREGPRAVVPLAVEALHSFIDGRHLELFFQTFEDLAARAGDVLLPGTRDAKG